MRENKLIWSSINTKLGSLDVQSVDERVIYLRLPQTRLFSEESNAEIFLPKYPKLFMKECFTTLDHMSKVFMKSKDVVPSIESIYDLWLKVRCDFQEQLTVFTYKEFSVCFSSDVISSGDLVGFVHILNHFGLPIAIDVFVRLK